MVSTSDTAHKSVSTRQLGVFVSLILLPLILFLIFPRDLVRDFVFVFLMGVGCSGLFTLYATEISVGLGKYRATGAVSILLLVLFFYLMLTMNTQVPQDLGNLETSGVSVKQARVLPNFFRTNSAVIIQDQPSQPAPDSTTMVDTTLKSVRIVYPVGVKKYQNLALQIKQTLTQNNPDLSIGTYSIGNLVKAVFNKESDFRPEMHIYIRSEVSDTSHEWFRNQLGEIEGYAVLEDPSVRSLGEEDAIIRLGY